MAVQQRSNFKKRANDFAIKDDSLFYKDKKDGSLRLVIGSEEEKKRVFAVGFA